MSSEASGLPVILSTKDMRGACTHFLRKGTNMRTLVRIAISMLLAVHAAGAAGQSASRAGRWDFTLQPQYSDSTSVTGGNGSSASISGAWGFGFGIAYNFNNHLALGGDLVWTNANYRATVVPAAGNPNSAYTVSGNLLTDSLRMNVTWNFLQTNFTPFVTGGIGATYVDTGIPNGPTSCWVDPWWGTYCGTPTKSNSYFSYNGGIGLRWDVNREFFLRGVAARQWIDVGGATGSPAVNQYRIDLGFKL
jgi:opacity protein-like surface antigen